MKLKKWMTLLAVLLLVAGATTLLYPHIVQWMYRQDVQRMAEVFEEEVAAAPQNAEGTALDDLYRQLQAQNTALFEDGQSNLVDPFSYQQPGFDLSAYGIGQNVIGYLEVPRIGETLPIYLGANEDNMAKGAVHLTQTSFPIGGENTNAVIAAHRGFYKAAMFRNIQTMELGDVVKVRNFRETLHYKVVGVEVIEPDQIEKVLIVPGRDMLTLLTCHPYGQDTQRYLVYCERAAESEI